MMAGFETPMILLFLLAIPVMYLLYRMYAEKKKKLAIKFSHIAFVKSALADQKKLPRHKALFYLSLVIIALMVIGFSGPHIPLQQAKEGVNVVLVMDISGSMQANDYQPTRLEAAKRSAEILMASLEDKDHAGVVVFESGATTAAYLSPYKEKVIDKLRAIAPKDGRTAIGDGLSLGIDMAVSIPNKKKVVILLSDGVSNSGVISPAEAVAFAQANEIQVFAIGMGSDQQVLLGYDFFGRAQYAEKVDEATLNAIAENTGGKYYRSVDDRTLDEIYEKISKDIKREKEETNIKDWFFIAALVLLVVELYMRYGPKRVIQ